jgi:hypothetical protein
VAVAGVARVTVCDTSSRAKPCASSRSVDDTGTPGYPPGCSAVS